MKDYVVTMTRTVVQCLDWHIQATGKFEARERVRAIVEGCNNAGWKDIQSNKPYVVGVEEVSDIQK